MSINRSQLSINNSDLKIPLLKSSKPVVKPINPLNKNSVVIDVEDEKKAKYRFDNNLNKRHCAYKGYLFATFCVLAGAGGAIYGAVDYFQKAADIEDTSKAPKLYVVGALFSVMSAGFTVLGALYGSSAYALRQDPVFSVVKKKVKNEKALVKPLELGKQKSKLMFEFSKKLTPLVINSRVKTLFNYSENLSAKEKMLCESGDNKRRLFPM